MKEKKLYINRYNFYAFNCSLILCIIIFLASFIIPILSILAPAVSSVGIIGGADGPTAIYVTTKIISLSFLIGVIGIVALWIMLFIKYKKDKDKIKNVSLKRTIACVCLSVILIIITNNWLPGLWALSLGIIMMFLWCSKKFEVADKDEVT